MESTGVYWKPVFHLLEGRFEVMLVNAQHIKQVPGRKTDVKDAEWIAQLLQHGLLSASFVPPPPIRELRDLTRQRAQLVRERAAVANRIQKVLEDANIKLAERGHRRAGRLGPGHDRGADRRARRPGAAGRRWRGAAAGEDPRSCGRRCRAGSPSTTGSCCGCCWTRSTQLEGLIARFDARIEEVMRPFRRGGGAAGDDPGGRARRRRR